MHLRSLAAAAVAALVSSSAFAYDQSYCREFTKTIYVGGHAQQGYGTSCMQPDGSWAIVQQPQPVNYQPQWQPAPPPVQYVERVEYVQPRYYAPRPYYRSAPAWPFFLNISYRNWGGRNDWNGHNDWHGHNDSHGHGGHWN